MFKIRKGNATKSHENEFFRHFAKSLQHVFDQAGMDGLLLGSPKSLLDDTLQIDALLITKGTITIIDFKNYSGEINLPKEDWFSTPIWETSDGIPVKGGSSSNPFLQLSKQRRKLIDLFSKAPESIGSVENKMVSIMACFCDYVTINGEIPRKKRAYFSIADKGTFPNKIIDIVDVTSDTNLLDEKFISYLNSKLFETREYAHIAEEEPPELKVSLDEISREEVSIVDTNALIDRGDLAAIENFINSETRTMIVTGTVGSGKENLIPHIRDFAHLAGYKNVEILVISNRVRNNLLKTQDDVMSLYSTIYDFSSVKEDESNSKRIIPLRALDYYQDEYADNTPSTKETLLIINESQMINDSYRDDPLIKFGSGKLLSDLIEYLKLSEVDCPNKVIFIGDNYQLSFGDWEKSSLNVNYFEELGISVTSLELPDSTEQTVIQETCIQIANAIRENNYSDLFIPENEGFSIVDRKDEFSCLSKIVDSQSSKILVYNNRQARDINLFIKEKIIKNGSRLSKNDLVVFDNQVKAFSPTTDSVDKDAPFGGNTHPFDFFEHKRIENGSFGIIEQIDDTDKFESYGTIKDENDKPIKLSFIKALIRLLDDSTLVETYILEDFLYSDSTRMGTEHEQEFNVFLQTLMDEKRKEKPFEKSKYYFEMKSDKNNYVEKEPGKYRDPNDLRSLTAQEKIYRNNLNAELLNDHSSTFFKAQNAARVKFGWCLTVHRAMSYEWGNVVFSTDRESQGRTNNEFFKWLYTGISRATNHVSLIRWRPITPFEKTEFGISSSFKKQQDFLLEGNGSIENVPAILKQHLLNVLGNEEIRISNTVSKNYQELITLVDSKNDETTMCFYYKKTGQVKYPSFVRGNKDLFHSIKNELKAFGNQKEIVSINSLLSEFYDGFQRINKNLKVRVLRTDAYQDIIEIIKDEEVVNVQVWYGKNLLISKFNYISGNKELFDQIVGQIKDFYGI